MLFGRGKLTQRYLENFLKLFQLDYSQGCKERGQGSKGVRGYRKGPPQDIFQNFLNTNASNYKKGVPSKNILPNQNSIISRSKSEPKIEK